MVDKKGEGCRDEGIGEGGERRNWVRPRDRHTDRTGKGKSNTRLKTEIRKEEDRNRRQIEKKEK